MTLKLSTLAVILGLGWGLPHIYGLMKPEAYATALRRFPRSLTWGYALTLLGTGWFLFNLQQESIADLATAKNILFFLFAGVGIGTCIFVHDFLAVRGLAVVLLLLAKVMVDTGRPHLAETHWTLVIQGWAYVMVIAGMWLTISPWRLRDAIEWGTATPQRIKIGSGVRLTFGLIIAALGLFKF
jgi:hypothetical protein